MASSSSTPSVITLVATALVRTHNDDTKEEKMDMLDLLAHVATSIPSPPLLPMSPSASSPKDKDGFVVPSSRRTTPTRKRTLATTPPPAPKKQRRTKVTLATPVAPPITDLTIIKEEPKRDENDPPAIQRLTILPREIFPEEKDELTEHIKILDGDTDGEILGKLSRMADLEMRALDMFIAASFELSGSTLPKWQIIFNDIKAIVRSNNAIRRIGAYRRWLSRKNSRPRLDLLQTEDIIADLHGWCFFKTSEALSNLWRHIRYRTNSEERSQRIDRVITDIIRMCDPLRNRIEALERLLPLRIPSLSK